MSTLQAAWLGSWKVPWDLGRGRRWGDPVWALVAIAQAWLLGGREGRWPVAVWESKRPVGPRIVSFSGNWTTRPLPEWISLLRHGSPEVPAHERGVREDELRAWCWEALIAGDGGPWMAAGSVLVDRETRTRWVPLLGGVADSQLILPPFLSPLIPESLHALPEGWWTCLLGTMDSEGRLLPEGSPPEDLPRSWLSPEGREYLDPLVLTEERIRRLGTGWQAWAHRTAEGWMLNPRIRAWARGQGASPQALAGLTPYSLARGDPPQDLEADILGLRLPKCHSLPAGWEASLQADLDEAPRPAPPPPSGNPVLDRLRVRWGGELPESGPGYPAWGQILHPCCDPFHWMAEGQRAFRAQELEGALRAFTWAHAHFTRLKSPLWAERAASNAETSALYWGGLAVSENWRRILRPLPSPFKEQCEVRFYGLRDEWEKATPLLFALLESHPELQHPWIILGLRGMQIGREDWIQRSLEHSESEEMNQLMRAYLEGMLEAPPPSMSPEIKLSWEIYRALKGRSDSRPFWQAWSQCPNGPLRLGTALDLLEITPADRTPRRLLELQVLADRTGVPRLQERLRNLWPLPETSPLHDPLSIVRAHLVRMGRPAWVAWGNMEKPMLEGVGEPPPDGALSGLQEMGTLPPTPVDGWCWRGFPIHWEGGAVAWGLVAHRPDEAITSCEELLVLAPWLVHLRSKEKPLDTPVGGLLLSDGSEPMGSLLRDLARVAPSELPVLIQGPTGSGKELAAHEVHRLSGRKGPLVPVNVTAFAEGVLESELFGHVRGAFTGADRDRKGAIEIAEGGTLFLDEVADLSPRLQSMLLRVLQDRMVRRVGSEKSRMMDVRFIAATHKSLEDQVAMGAFRKDLLFRLQGTVLELPSLRARRHEFPYLFPRLVVQVARESRLPCPDIAPGLAQALSGLPWPGNFRELRHAIQRALLRCGEGTLRPDHFPELEEPAVATAHWEESTRDFQRKLLVETLCRHDFQVTEAARTLGLTRPALYLAAKRLGVDLAAERIKREVGCR